MQGRDRGDAGAIRVGFTVTKKIGNAVVRNCIRRRLREAARQVLPQAGKNGHDYVLVARHQALTMSFEGLVRDLERAIRKLHAPAESSSGPSSASPRKPRPKAGGPSSTRHASDSSNGGDRGDLPDSGPGHMGPVSADPLQVSQSSSGISAAAVSSSAPVLRMDEAHGPVMCPSPAVPNADESIPSSSLMRVSDAHAPALSEAPPAADGGLPA